MKRSLRRERWLATVTDEPLQCEDREDAEWRIAAAFADSGRSDLAIPILPWNAQLVSSGFHDAAGGAEQGGGFRVGLDTEHGVVLREPNSLWLFRDVAGDAHGFAANLNLRPADAELLGDVCVGHAADQRQLIGCPFARVGMPENPSWNPERLAAGTDFE